MQLQFSKKKPTRIGMQFLFYESLYTVGIIANFNKNITESLLFNAFDMKAICEMGFKVVNATKNANLDTDFIGNFEFTFIHIASHRCV